MIGVLEFNNSTTGKVVERKYFFPNQELHSFANKHVRWDSNSSTKRTSVLQRNLSKLKDFLTLSEDWNGSGALPFTQELISLVQALILKLNPQPEIFPTGRNSIQLEYERENGDYLEFEIFKDHVNCFEILNGKENEMEIAFDQIFSKVQEFISSQSH